MDDREKRDKKRNTELVLIMPLRSQCLLCWPIFRNKQTNEQINQIHRNAASKITQYVCIIFSRSEVKNKNKNLLVNDTIVPDTK